jgi:predicted small metal-binding protein
MKTMTCRQLGGPCDLAHRGDTGDEVIHAQDRHLKEVVAAGDTAHEAALQEMKGRWKNPVGGLGWYRRVKKEFKALPDS